MIISDTHDALVSFFTDLGDRSWETAIRSIRRAALAIKAKKKFLLPEQTFIDGNVHATPVGDMFSDIVIIVCMYVYIYVCIYVYNYVYLYIVAAFVSYIPHHSFLICVQINHPCKILDK